MIHKTLILLAILISNIAVAQNDNEGYIYNLKLDIDERLRSIDYEKSFEGYTDAKYRDGNPVMAKAIFTGNEVNEFLDNLVAILQPSLSVTSVQYLSAQKIPSAKKELGKFGKSVLNEGMLDKKVTFHTMEFFPSISLKKALESNSKEYYDLKVKIKWGGNASEIIVMNKVKKAAFVKYSIDLTMTAAGGDKKEIWEKKGTFNNFTKNVSGSVDKNYFKIEGTQTLSIDDLEKSILIAVDELINQ